MQPIRLQNRFPQHVVQRYFQAVEENDVTTLDATLSGSIMTACPEREIEQCFTLALQFWSEGFTRSEFIDLIKKIARHGHLRREDALRFKHIRARYKQLRFACVLYTRGHAPPRILHTTVATMGKLQDAYRNRARREIRIYSIALRLLMSMPVWLYIRWKVSSRPTISEVEFTSFRTKQITALERAVNKVTLSGREFHATRKIVSQFVAFYDARRSIQPSPALDEIARFLATINGLMGARHDEMIRSALTGTHPYETPIPVPAEIRTRVQALIAHYPVD